MATKDKTPPPARKRSLPGKGKDGKVGGPGKGEAVLTDAERKRQRRKAATLLAILIALIIIAIILILRALTGNNPLPGIPSELPHHVSDIYGANGPMDVAISPSGDRVYVTESQGRRLVRVFDGSGKPVDTLKPPGRKGKWRLPVYAAIDPQTENVYVSDRLREDVDVYGPKGKFRKAFRPRGRLGRGANPLGLAFDPEGDLFMTDVSGKRRDHRVLVFGTGENRERPERKIGSPGMFWFPNGLTLDESGNLYVADSNNGRLAIFDPLGKLVSSIRRGVGDGDLGLPRGVAVDGDRLFVVDTTSHTIKVYRLPGEATEVPTYVGSFGVEGIEDGAFRYPNGIAIDGDGRIYVTDRENDRVQIWSY